jgi:release factor glutamine methyltransferase
MSTAPWTVGRLLQWTAEYLKNHGSESPRLDAEVLLAHALGCQRIELYTRFEEEPSEAARATFREFVKRRAEGMPVAYLVGQREFYSLTFRVTPDVLIPRPETELLVVAALDWAKEGAGEEPKWNAEGGRGITNNGDQEIDDEKQHSPPSPFPLPPSSSRPPSPAPCSIADVGTGSGAIAVAVAKHLPGCRVTAIDSSAAALAVARKNAAAHGLAERIEFVESDLFSAVPADKRFDLIVSNPPYVLAAEYERLPNDVRQYEPRGALLAGPRGTEVIERLVAQSAERLRPGGGLLMEISPTIHDAVCELIAADTRFERGPTIKDLARLPRVVQARRSR